MIKEIRLTHEAARNAAMNFIKQLPVDSKYPLRMLIDEEKHSSTQLKKVWAMADDLSMQAIWFGKLRPKSTWKNLLGFQALKDEAEENGKSFELEFLPCLDKSTLLSDYISIRNLNKKLFIRIINIALQTGDELGVQWSNEAKEVIKLAEQYKDQLSKVETCKKNTN
ncbi:recombination protein NinB [uncultured Gilliamella sp.]|uniref:recombination protein NinB n=1 Tax=uncultured Gilliamella sp. TaxID=1193505 RepID=UPI0025F627C1|nr:recombination protein NinB [uncultured Gilliamella sp.]